MTAETARSPDTAEAAQPVAPAPAQGPDAIPARFRLQGISPAEVLALLPGMGKVMVIANANGVTFERIGPVERLEQDGPALRIQGACHDAAIDAAALAAVEVDHSSVMRGKVYPRLDFLGPDGASVVAVVGMDGAEPFDAALAALARTEVAPKAREPGETRPDLAPDDPALAPFTVAQELGAELRMTFARPGLTQGWRGKVEAVKPAMGFLNVMTPDFHLHLQGGTVGGWDASRGERRALGPDGRPTGLVLHSDIFA